MKMMAVDCPHCGATMNGLMPTNNPEATGPHNGDRTLCTMCAGVSTWDTVDGQLVLREPTAEEEQEIAEDGTLQSLRRLVLSRLN